MESVKKWATSWFGIILAFFLFWPIGFVFLYLRFFYNGGKLRVKANLFRGLAILCYFCTVCILLIIPESTGVERQENVTIFAVFLIGGIASTIPTYKAIKQYKYYKKYSDYIFARAKVTVEELSEKMGKSIETVTEDIAKVFEYQMIHGYITEDNEVIVLRNGENNKQSSYVVQEKTQILTIKCKNCGATNKFVVGKENKCEYCDSLLIHN